jgi:hypothetical protein
MTSNQPWWLTWPVEEAAAAILPVFGHQVQSCPYKDEDDVLLDIVTWCKTGQFAEKKLFRAIPGRQRFTTLITAPSTKRFKCSNRHA